MLMSIEAIGFLLFLALTVLIWKRRTPKRYPPGSEGIFIWGSLPFIGRHLERSLAQWGWNNYGPIFYYTKSGKRIIVFNTFQSVTEGFVKRGSRTSGRQPKEVGEQLPFSDHSEGWKNDRMLRFTTIKNFPKCNVEGIISKECEAMCESKMISNVNSAGINAADFITLPTFNIVTSVICGRRANFDFDLLRVLTEPIYEKEEESTWFGKKNDRGQYRVTFLKNMVLEWDLSGENSDGIMNNPHNFTKEQFTKFIVDLLVAGTDTMATTVHWTLVFLASHSHIQQQAYEEIDRVVGQEQLTTKFLDFLPYTRAILQESARLRPVFPLSLPHNATDDVEVCGYVIPKGSPIIANLWAVQNDPKYFKNPENFMPERHLDKSSGEFLKSDKVLHFSVGPRFCLGSQLASIHHFIFVVSLIRKFSFSIPPGSLHLDNRGKTAQVLAPVGIKLCLEPR